MTQQVRLHFVDWPKVAAPTPSERFIRALVDLTRMVWHPTFTFESSLSRICEVAAEALRIERVSIWHHDQEAGVLRCLDVYQADDGTHHSTEGLEMLWARDDVYLAALEDVRTFEMVEVGGDAENEEPLGPVRDYMQQHGIVAMLDAPAYVEGEFLGVICHESLKGVRKWTQEEVTFAATMGDVVAMAYEVARRRKAESEIEHLRLHDADTGLGNRDYLVELLRQRLDGVLAGDDTMAVVHVLVDATSGIAWSAEAPTIDEVMARIAQRLRRLTGSSIDLARVRANGFSFLLPSNVRQRSAIGLAERALAAVQAMEWSHDEVHPNASAGIAFAQSGADNDARVLLGQAEEAAGHAQSGDKFNYEVFDPGRHDTLVEALRFERVLRDAFVSGAFEVHYQPEYDAQQREWVAAEALLRWRNEGQLVTAGEFIGVVESSGLMLPVGRWVLRQACVDAQRWPATPGGALASVRVNVSARQFDEEGLVQDVTSALEESGLAPARLCLELTETTLMRDIEHALGVLQQLKTIGVQVAIDDFGTGYASLVYLKRLPVDVLKIDRSFVDGMPGAVADTAIVKAVVGLAAALGIDVIAEGVERVVQQQALQGIGVRRMQGWLYGRAVDQESISRLLGAPVQASS